jgi:hypothetical protein
MSLKSKPKMLKNPKMLGLIKEMTENHLQNLEIYTDILSEYKTKVKEDVKEIKNTLVAVKESLTERLNKYVDFLKEFMRESSKYFRDESEAISYRTLLKSSTAMNEILKYVEFVNEELQTLKNIKDSQSFMRLTERTEKLQSLTSAINRISIDDYIVKKKRGPMNITKEKIRSKNEKLGRGREKEIERVETVQRVEREQEKERDERVNINNLSGSNLINNCANLKNFNSFKNSGNDKLENLSNPAKNNVGNLNNPNNMKSLNSNLIDLQTPEFPRVTDLKFQSSGNSNNINLNHQFDPKNFNNLNNYTNNVMNLSQSHNSSHSPPKKLLNQNFSRERDNFNQSHSQERENFHQSHSRERDSYNLNLSSHGHGSGLHHGLNNFNHAHSVAHNRSLSHQSKDTHPFSHFNFLQNKTHRQREPTRSREQDDNFYFSREGKFTDERSLDEDLIEEDEYESNQMREPVREVRESIREVRESIRDQLQHKEPINLRDNVTNLNLTHIRDSNREPLRDSSRITEPIREVMKEQPIVREKSRENSREHRDQIREIREPIREREVMREQVIGEKSRENSREPREIKDQIREPREQIREQIREKSKSRENSRELREQIRDQIRESSREQRDQIREQIREPIKESTREKVREIQINNPVINPMHLSVNNINLVQREIPAPEIPEARTPSMDSLGLDYEDSYNPTPIVPNSKFNEVTNFNIKDKDLLGVGEFSNSRDNQLEQEPEPEEDLKPNIETNYDPQNIESLLLKFKQFIILDKLGSYILSNVEELIHFKVVYKSDYIYNFPQNYSLEKEFLIKDQSFVNLKKNFENVQLTILKKENDNRHLSACVKLIEKYFKFFVRRKDEHGNLMFKGVLSCDFISFENYFSNAYKAFEPIETIQIEVFLFKYDLFTDYDESYDKTNLHRNEMKILIDNGKIINALRKHYS